ncbi:MAG: hypothetical protein ACRC67_39450 [Inquilinus sp.]|uniref:hypothetical protein n=1 Tax=Inquilinus sp. TaxID=1932117 RepID=UPI003F327EB9
MTDPDSQPAAAAEAEVQHAADRGDALCSQPIRRNTLAQLALFCSSNPSTLALRSTLEEVLRVPEVNRRLADEGSGFGVAIADDITTPASDARPRRQ